MAWIESLSMQTWFINVLAGDGNFFSILALFSIVSLSAFFRMNGIAMAFMVGVFLLMFSAYIPAGLTIFITIIAGLLFGYSISKIVK
jgi:hypothetical protein